MKRALCFLSVSVAAAFGASAAGDPRPGVDWPSFRGIAASGIGDGKATPTTWNASTGTGVKWKTAIAGLGHSSPVIWGDLVCVATATSDGDQSLKVGLYGDIAPVNDTTEKIWKVICLDKKSGAMKWERELRRGVPAVKRHTKATHANSTLATDGERIVSFLGSEGLHALDMKGPPLWNKDFGVLESGYFMFPAAQWGFASSPILHDGRVIVQADVFKGSFVAAFDAKTGKEIWKASRADVPTWSTPAVYTGPGPSAAWPQARASSSAPTTCRRRPGCLNRVAAITPAGRSFCATRRGEGPRAAWRVLEMRGLGPTAVARRQPSAPTL